MSTRSFAKKPPAVFGNVMSPASIFLFFCLGKSSLEVFSISGVKITLFMLTKGLGADGSESSSTNGGTSVAPINSSTFEPVGFNSTAFSSAIWVFSLLCSSRGPCYGAPRLNLVTCDIGVFGRACVYRLFKHHYSRRKLTN